MNLIISFLIISQILIFPLLSFRWIKEFSFQIFIVSFLCYAIWKYNKWIASFVAWSFFLFLLTKSLVVNDYNSRISYDINILSFFNIINIVLYGVIYILLIRFPIDKDKIYKSFCFIALFHSIYVILQFLNLDQFFRSISLYHTPGNPLVGWPVGTWGNEALVSWCIAICSPFFLAYKDMRWKVGYLICFIAILCTKCTAGILGFVVGFLFWLWNKNKKWFICAVSILFISSLLLVFSGKCGYFLQDTHRYMVWKKAISISKETPITGHGLGSFRGMFPYKAQELRTDGNWAQAHNEYIQIFFEHGLVGVGIICGLIFTTLLKFFRSKKGVIPIASVLITLFVSLVGFPFRTAMGALAIISLVLFERETWQDVQT